MCSSTFRLWCVKRLDTTGTESQRFSGAITDYVFVVVCRSIMDQKLFAIFQPSFVYLSVMTNKWVMFYCMLMHHLALANWLAAFVAYRDCVCVCVRACVRVDFLRHDLSLSTIHLCSWQFSLVVFLSHPVVYLSIVLLVFSASLIIISSSSILYICFTVLFNWFTSLKWQQLKCC